MSGELHERGQHSAPGLRPAAVPRTSLPTKPPPSSSTLRNDKLLPTIAHIATLTAELAAERAEVERLRAEHTFVERLVAGQLLSRMTELEADLALLGGAVRRHRAEVERLRAAGDALATNLQQMEDLYHSRTCKGMNTERIDNCTCLLALAAWQEARRER